MKTIAKILFPVILAIGLGSCVGPSSENINKYMEKDGLIVKTWVDGMGRHLRIDYKEGESSYERYLHAMDWKEREGTFDGRFDEVTLRNVPKGDLLEKYVNLDSLNGLYKEVIESEIEFDTMTGDKK